MGLEVIYVTRHGFRSNWVVDHNTGEYSATIKSPTGIASDPALAGKGVEQARELSAKLVTLDPPIERFYSSPFYRCLQTIDPTLQTLSSSSSPSTSSNDPERLKIRADNGVGEWYGTARFTHPSPAAPELLHSFFPRFDLDYKPTIVPSSKGETIDELHDRTAYALHRIIEQSDREGVKAIIICTHAATLIAIGRALTGNMPDDIEVEDFHPFTCSLSKFIRRSSGDGAAVAEWEGLETPIPHVPWRGGKGVGGGWDCIMNGDCSFLSGGAERGWRFSGDESFQTAPTEGSAIDSNDLGVVINGDKSIPKDGKENSRL